MVGLSRELRILRDALLFFILVDFPSRGIGKIKKGIPDSAESGQPARLDRAGPQARTRLSPEGGKGETLYGNQCFWCIY